MISLLVAFFLISSIEKPSLADNSLGPYGHWQCSLPQSKSIAEIINFKSTFVVVGYSPWMTNKRTYICCYQRGLRTVPKGLDNGVQILNLGRNSITHIRKNDFDEYEQLVAVLLHENCFSANINDFNIPTCSQRFITIDSGAFAKLLQLNYLDISYNKIKNTPVNLPNSLKFLAIELAELRPIDSQDFKTLENLEMVMLGRNCIEVALSKLCQGNFSLNNFSFSSNNLSYLDLSFNDLKKVPNHVFVRNLVGITLQGNPIHVVRSDDFNSCPNITYLILSWTSKYDKIPMKIISGAFDNLIHLTYLDLSGNMLSGFPDFSLQTKLSSIKFAYNCLQMSATNPTNLSFLPLTELTFYGNTFCDKETYPIKQGVSKLEIGEAFSKFSKLESIQIERFSSLNSPNINELHWILSYGYQYDYVDESSLKFLQRLSNLKRLSLAFCGIKFINISMFCNFNLSILDLSVNKIQQLSLNTARDCQESNEGRNHHVHHAYSPETLSHFLYRQKQLMQTIKHQHSDMLLLSKNALIDLPNNAFKCFSKFTFLDLSYNQISYIRSSIFAHMTSLKTLNLRFNPIRQIYPSSKFGLSKLNTLMLNYSTLQGEFTLKFLQHTSNNFTLDYGDITDNIYRLLKTYQKNSTKFHSVSHIDFCYNPIMIYYILNNNPIFEPFPNLQRITLEYAELRTELGSNFFRGVPNVTHVALRNCLLQEFPFKALAALPKLLHLDLSHNYLEFLNKSWFDHVSNLTSLTLSDNFIRYIVPGTLRLLVDKGLRRLDLSNNFISDVSVAIIDQHILSKLLFLDLRRNPLICDCSLTRSFGWLIYSKNSSQLHIPGFLPVCPIVVNNYYGGCLTCSSARGFLSQPPSLFLHSLSTNCEEQFVVVLTISFTLSIFIFIAISLLCNCKPLQNRLITLWLKANLVPTNEDAEGTDSSSVKYAFDAFVIYDTIDSSIGDWVDFRMVPKLKNSSPSLKIGVMEREDWCGLNPSVQQLLFRIEASYKTVVLLTDNYAQSLQCKYILAMLEQRVYLKGEDRCIIITFQEYPPTGKWFQIRRRRNQWSVLNLPDINKDENVFLELLRNAIATKQYRV